MDILNALLKNKNFSDLQQMNEEAAAEMLIIDQQYATRNLNEKTAPKCKKCGSRHWPFQNCKASTKSKGKKKKVKEAFYAHLKKLKSIREAKYVVVGNGRSYPIVALREQLRVKVGKGIAAKSVAINKLGLKEGHIVAPGFGKILRFKINESIIPDWSKDNEETQIKKLVEDEIVKGGESDYLPFGVYRKGYDIVKGKNEKFYLQVMNGMFQIFKSDEFDTAEEAESVGLEQLKSKKPLLYQNTVGESIIPDWSKDNEETQIKKLIESEAKFDDGRVIPYAGLSIRQLFERGRAGKDKEYLLKFINTRFGGSLIERELKKLFEATEKKIASKLREADDDEWALTSADDCARLIADLIEDADDWGMCWEDSVTEFVQKVLKKFSKEELAKAVGGRMSRVGRWSEREVEFLEKLLGESLGLDERKLREADDEQEDEVDFEPLGDEKEEEQPFDDIPADEELPPEEELDPDPGIDEEEDEGIPRLTDKMFFGKKNDKFYYIQPAGGEEEGSKTGFEIIDAEGKVVLTSKDVEAQGEEVYDFILEAVKKLEVEMISFDIFIQFIAPKIEELKQEEEEESIGVDNTEDEFAPVEDEEPVAAPVESKQLHEVKVTLDRREFDVHLLDETGGDATISISGKDFKLNNAFLTAYRKDGKITEDVLRELALDVLANIDDEQFEVLATKAKVVDKEVSDSKQIQK